MEDQVQETSGMKIDQSGYKGQTLNGRAYAGRLDHFAAKTTEFTSENLAMVVEKLGGDSSEDIIEKYAHLNPGQQKMCMMARIRALSAIEAKPLKAKLRKLQKRLEKEGITTEAREILEEDIAVVEKEIANLPSPESVFDEALSSLGWSDLNDQLIEQKAQAAAKPKETEAA